MLLKRMNKTEEAFEEGASDVQIAIEKAEAEERAKHHVPTEDEVMIMVGFDPDKGDDYTNAELDAFSKKAIAMNKTLGRTENGGIGSLEGPDGRNYGRYEPDFITGFFDKRSEKKEFQKKLAADKAAKYGKEAEVEPRVDEIPTGLGTVFSREGGPRGGGKKKK